MISTSSFCGGNSRLRRETSRGWDPWAHQAQMPGLPAFSGGQNVLTTATAQESEPRRTRLTAPQRDPPPPSERKTRERKDQSRQHALRRKVTAWPVGSPGETTCITLTHFGSWRLGSFSMVIFFASSRFLLSSQIVFGLVLVNGQSVTTASGVLNWKSVHRALTAHPSFFSRDYSSSALCATAS